MQRTTSARPTSAPEPDQTDVPAALPLLDVALDALEAALRHVGAEQWGLPTACTGWDVRQVTNHIVAAQDYFIALLDGAPRQDALERLLALDVLGADPPAAQLVRGAALRDAFRAPGALERVGHHVITDMTGAQLLDGCVVELSVHALDVARATSFDLVLDERLAACALAIAERLAPVFVANGFAAPSLEVDASARAQDRLLAVCGRRP